MILDSIYENRRGLSSVLGGFLIHITLGNIYSFGNLMTYMVSYMHKYVSEDISYSNFIWVNAVTTATQGLFMVTAGILEKKMGVKLICFTGSCLLSCGIALTFFTVKISFLAVIFTYGFLSGLGISLSYVTPLACGMKWFPQRKGFVSGIIVGGFGLGSLVSTLIQTAYLNPNNIPPSSSGYFEDPSILDKVPYVFLLMGGIFFCLQLFSCLLISAPSEKIVVPSNSETENLLFESPGNPDTDVDVAFLDNNDAKKHLGPREAVRRYEFWLLWCIFLLCTMAVGYMNAMQKSFGQTFISDDRFLSGVVAAAALFNCAGRVAWGKFMDKSSFRLSMIVMSCSLSALLFSLPATSVLGKIAFAMWVWGIFFCFSGTFVLISTATEKAFGETYYSENYGLIFTNQFFSAILLSTLNQALLHLVGYMGCFFSIASLVAICALMALCLPRGL